MKKIIKVLCLFLMYTAVINAQAGKPCTKYVDPFAGTGGHGHTYPGAAVPWGMIQLSPDNPSKGWDWTSGYNYSDSVLLGFSHPHLSGTGVGDLYDILFMPFISPYPENTRNGYKRVYSIYSHKDEFAEPGYYYVKLPNENIKAEMTTAERTGYHRYTFGKGVKANILIDLGYAQNFDRPVETCIKAVDKTTIVGYRISAGWAKNQPVYFTAKFSKPFEYKFYNDKKLVEGSEIKAERAEAVLSFEPSDENIVMVKVALSSASIDGAAKNMDIEIPGWDFDKVRRDALNKWETELGKFKIEDKNEEAKKIFYTSLYHSYLAPNLFTDENKEYYGADGKTHKADGYKRYTLFSLWDTFRGLHPLLTITKPEVVDDLVKSMLGFYDEYGLLPTWDLESNETDVMIGYHAVPVIYDAYKKGLTTADPERIYKAFKTSAMQDKFGINYFKQYGFIPSELEVEAVSKVLEYSYDDWCIAQMAKALGKEEDYKYFSKRAEAYKLYFDKSTGFMRGKDKEGNWVKNFNPLFVKHRATDYTEANAWQYTFHVLQDVEGLISLFGGEKEFINKLDSLFITNDKLEGEELSPDISGMIGQYVHGNEPCHHVAYLYSFTGKAYKTQERISQIMKTMYKTGPEALIGNDDCGQMSAWYVLSALGFYPVNPADGKFWFGTPLFNKVSMELKKGKIFTIKADNVSEKNIYIKSVKLNGKTLGRNYITYDEIMSGGELIFEMTGFPQGK